MSVCTYSSILTVLGGNKKGIHDKESSALVQAFYELVPPKLQELLEEKTECPKFLKNLVSIYGSYGFPGVRLYAYATIFEQDGKKYLNTIKNLTNKKKEIKSWIENLNKTFSLLLHLEELTLNSSKEGCIQELQDIVLNRLTLLVRKMSQELEKQKNLCKTENSQVLGQILYESFRTQRDRNKKTYLKEILRNETQTQKAKSFLLNFDTKNLCKIFEKKLGCEAI